MKIAVGTLYSDLREALGLDQSLAMQYFIYMSNLLSGDLGQSISFSSPVSEVLLRRMGNTALLAGAAIFLASVAGVAAGTWAALRPGSLRDRGLTIAVLFLNSMPSFWLGLVLILIFGLHLRVLPVSGMPTRNPACGHCLRIWRRQRHPGPGPGRCRHSCTDLWRSSPATAAIHGAAQPAKISGASRELRPTATKMPITSSQTPARSMLARFTDG